MKLQNKNKLGQEEMIGFALIIVLVMVILVIFLGFSLNKPQKDLVESYEIESFISASLQYTSNCADIYEPKYLSIKELIYYCGNMETCSNEEDACEVLENTLNGILEESWRIEKDSRVKGYVLNITSNNEEIIMLKKGNITNSYKGNSEYLSKGVDISFTAYY